MTGSSYLIGTSQIGTTLRATVTATNSAGKTSAFSNLTTAVLAKAGSPVNSTLPAISGSQVGRTDAAGLDRRLDGRHFERVRLPVESL